jgi:hypothetical protein
MKYYNPAKYICGVQMTDGGLIGDPVGLDGTWLKFCDFECPSSKASNSVYRIMGAYIDIVSFKQLVTVNSNNACTVDRIIPSGSTLVAGALDFTRPWHFYDGPSQTTLQFTVGSSTSSSTSATITWYITICGQEAIAPADATVPSLQYAVDAVKAYEKRLWADLVSAFTLSYGAMQTSGYTETKCDIKMFTLSTRVGDTDPITLSNLI